MMYYVYQYFRPVLALVFDHSQSPLPICRKKLSQKYKKLKKLKCQYSRRKLDVCYVLCFVIDSVESVAEYIVCQCIN